ncbi:uncharacterized protein [Apostichopus japonicus]|uniref:uncharacterized protein n=1 Tax=Stichopus japonicus TaxID=307972 RepID=UPI003AB3F723
MTGLKSTGVAVGKVVLVAIGVLYGVAILINSLHGWPQSDPDQSRFCKQLRPSRVLSLNYTLWDQCSMLKWVPLFIRAKWLHDNADPSLKNIPFGENGLTMDIWLPKSKDHPQQMPVVFFIHGGGWGSGSKEIYAKLGQELANNLTSTVVIPDYRIYPKGTMQDMVTDISDALLEFRKLSNTSHFSGDTSKVILMGHSAGAHLSALAAIHLAAKDCNSPQQEPVFLKNSDGNDQDTEQDQIRYHKSGEENIVTDPKGNVDSEECEGEKCTSNTGHHARETEEHLVPNSEREENPAETMVDLVLYVKGVIGISGVYHLMDYYHHESTRGMEDISLMWRAAEGLQNFEKYSPVSIVPSLNDSQIKRIPPHMLIHGMKDTMAPFSSASKFAETLSGVGVPVTFKLLPEGGHLDLAVGMMEPDRKWYSEMMSMVMEGAMSFLKDGNT